MAEAQELRRLVDAYPIIDSHAHNMVKGPMATSYDDYPLETMTTEGEDFSPTPEFHKAISFHTAVKQLAKLHNCAADFEVIKVARNKAIEDDYDGLVKKCLQGTQMLLIDNSEVSEEIHYYEWYDRFTPGQSGSVAHIEALAENVIQTIVDIMPSDANNESQVITDYWPKFKDALQDAVKVMLSDPDVKALRSVANYRTGLNIQRSSEDEVATCFETYCQALRLRGASNYLCAKPLNDYVVDSILDTLQELQSKDGAKSIPFQFNTGAGAPDADLLYSSPVQLQGMIEKYDEVDFVFLHASRPFLAEAAHMASVYSNVYLTFGEIFPMVSRDGQISIIRECFETTPTNKILWASGSIYHPESYWLAGQQFRHALATVLEDYIDKGDHTLSQAKRIAKDIMFNNANTLYSLDQQAKYTPSDKIPPSATTAPQRVHSTLSIRPTKPTLGPDDKSIDVTRSFTDEYPSVKFIWIQWVDYNAAVRARMVPVAEFIKLFTGKKLEVPQTTWGLIEDGAPAPSRSICLYPDVNTLSIDSSLERDIAAPLNATVMAFIKTEDGKRHPDCPRAMLQGIVEKYKKDFEASFLIGFELHVTIFEEPKNRKDEEAALKLWLQNRAWSSVMSDTPDGLDLVQNVLTEFSQAGIEFDQFYTAPHSQLVFHLQPSTPLKAVDSLIKARQIISRVAANDKLIATVCPWPTPEDPANNAAPVQISISPPSAEDSFVKGVSQHFTTIQAFTFPQEISYGRCELSKFRQELCLDDSNTAAFQRLDPGELKFTAMDGLANPYLALAAILAGGYTGLEQNTKPFPIEGSEGMSPLETLRKPFLCSMQEFSPFTSTVLIANDGLNELGSQGYSAFPEFHIPAVKLSQTLDESFEALRKDRAIHGILGWSPVARYIEAQRAQQQLINREERVDRWLWVVRRY